MKPECEFYLGWVIRGTLNLSKFCEALLQMSDGVVLAMRLGVPGDDVVEVLKKRRGN